MDIAEIAGLKWGGVYVCGARARSTIRRALI
jgi:hypothetical protein